MSTSFPSIIYYLVGILLLILGIFILLSENTVHSLIFLLSAFLLLVQLAILLKFELLALILIIIYLGAISILLINVFALTMSFIPRSNDTEGKTHFLPLLIPAILIPLIQLYSIFSLDTMPLESESFNNIISFSKIPLESLMKASQSDFLLEYKSHVLLKNLMYITDLIDTKPKPIYSHSPTMQDFSNLIDLFQKIHDAHGKFFCCHRTKNLTAVLEYKESILEFRRGPWHDRDMYDTGDRYIKVNRPVKTDVPGVYDVGPIFVPNPFPKRNLSVAAFEILEAHYNPKGYKGKGFDFLLVDGLEPHPKVTIHDMPTLLTWAEARLNRQGMSITPENYLNRLLRLIKMSESITPNPENHMKLFRSINNLINPQRSVSELLDVYQYFQSLPLHFIEEMQIPIPSDNGWFKHLIYRLIFDVMYTQMRIDEGLRLQKLLMENGYTVNLSTLLPLENPFKDDTLKILKEALTRKEVTFDINLYSHPLNLHEVTWVDTLDQYKHTEIIGQQLTLAYFIHLIIGALILFVAMVGSIFISLTEKKGKKFQKLSKQTMLDIFHTILPEKKKPKGKQNPKNNNFKNN